MIRLTVFLLAAAAVAAAQNPLAALGDPFSGAYQNEQIRMELLRNGKDYTGSITLSGQNLPVHAVAAGGKLTGKFSSGGKSYAFEAVRTGSQLSITTDGVTHNLEAIPAAPATAPPPFVGDWQSRSGPVRILADGTALIGDKSQKWSLDGSVLKLTAGTESVEFPFDLAGDTWTWKLPVGQLVLTRVTPEAAKAEAQKGIAGTWQGPSGSVQINLDGSAVVAGVPYRYTLNTNQLKLTGPDGTFVATVQQAGDTMTWAVNGKTLQFQRAASTWALGGTDGIAPELAGKWCRDPSDCLTLLIDGSFYATGDTGTWTAEGDRLTVRSRKTGVRTYRLEKRNDPKTGEPQLVLDGATYASAYAKAPWQ